MAATLLGIAAGWACHRALTPQQAAQIAGGLALITESFLRLIRMIIAPLVFSTLATAIARMRGAAEIGRIGAKALGWFLAASCVSLTLGLLLAQALQPGTALHLSSPASANAAAAPLTVATFMRHLIPVSIAAAMADNEILQIVLFSLFFGVAAAALKDGVRQVVEWLEQLAAIMFKVTDYVMLTAPLAIFAALAGTVSMHGIGILGTYARFVGGFYLGLGVLWGVLIAALRLLVGARSRNLLARIRQPALLAFATASSEAAYPRLLEALVAFGIPRRIASFVLPLGYSFNLDGSMMYCTFAIVFLAQAYGISLTLAQQIALFGLLIVTTKGVAGVPRAALAVVAVTLHFFAIPDGAIALVIAVDHLLDMGRSATNVVGNSVAAAVIAKWEGRHEPRPASLAS